MKWSIFASADVSFGTGIETLVIGLQETISRLAIQAIHKMRGIGLIGLLILDITVVLKVNSS